MFIFVFVFYYYVIDFNNLHKKMFVIFTLDIEKVILSLIEEYVVCSQRFD